MWKKSSDHPGDPESQGESSAAPAPKPRGESSGTERASQDNRVKEHRRSVLSPSMTLKGDISGTEDLVLEGKMEGTINLPKNEVLIGSDGQVKADVTALKVTVEGRVLGDVRGSERVVVKNSGRIEGNIVAPRVVLEDGCQFKGSVEMNIESGSSASTASRPQEQSGSKARDSRPKSDSGNNSRANQYTSGAKSPASSAS